MLDQSATETLVLDMVAGGGSMCYVSVVGVILIFLTVVWELSVCCVTVLHAHEFRLPKPTTKLTHLELTCLIQN